jgi:sulfur carrier protein
MELIINGKTHDVPEGINIFDLINQLGLNPDIIAVEKNSEIIDKQNYKNEVLKNRDELELIRFMGGG